MLAREKQAAKRARARAIRDALAAAYPHSTCALDHEGPFQLLVATMLSAQTTDVKVNQVTPELFARWPGAHELARADVARVGGVIGSIGLWRNKARNVVAMSQALIETHDAQVPQDIGALVALPGVGRKTATAVLGTAFGVAAGITVDTHMLRINRLLRLSTRTDPEKMAAELERLLEPASWAAYTHRIIDHGRLVCVARRPRCGVCPLQGLCPSAFSGAAGYKPQHDERVPASAAAVSWKARRV